MRKKHIDISAGPIPVPLLFYPERLFPMRFDPLCCIFQYLDPAPGSSGSFKLFSENICINVLMFSMIFF